jgi:hypothetical protein
MSRPRRPAALILAVSVLAAGCGSTARPASGTAPPPAPAPLATSLVTAGGTWAVVPMAAAPGAANLFWDLFVYPAAGTGWALVTPPAMPTNGGLVLAATGGRSLVTGIPPSIYLTYSLLATTGDDGHSWSPGGGPLDGPLAGAPDALAAAPAGNRLLALLTDGAAVLGAGNGTGWARLTSQGSLAVSPAGRRCSLVRLSAAAFSPSGVPMVAGACAHPGTAGIFAYAGGTWQDAGPLLPAMLAGQDVEVLRLARTGARMVALLEAGAGPAASLTAAWTSDGGGHWTISSPFRLGGAQLRSTSLGAGGGVGLVLTGDRGLTLAGPGSSWRPLPALPADTVTLAFGPAGGLDALAVRATTLTGWTLASASAAWSKKQTISVQIGAPG